MNGAALGELSAAIVSAFDQQELEELVRITFSERLYDEYVPRGLRDGDAVFKLLEALERRGTTLLLLRAVLRARPCRNDVRSVITRVHPDVLEKPRDTGTEVDIVLGGLQTLRARLGDNAVADLLRSSRRDLEGLSEGFDTLRSYKDLHDGLHQLQLLQYGQLTENVKRLRTDPLASDALNTIVSQLQAIGDGARGAADLLPNTPESRGLEMKWINEFQAIVKDFDTAVAELDDVSAAKGVRSLGKIIRIQPFRIDGILTAKAEALPLARLIDTIESVNKGVDSADPAAKSLKSAASALQNLSPQFKGLVTEHNRWQQIQNELWGADQAIEQRWPEAIDDFNDYFSKAQSLVNILRALYPDADWSKAAGTFGDQLQQELVRDVQKARGAYGRYRQVIIRHFYQIDVSLKSQCAEILRIGKVLRFVLSEVPNAQ
jgi:hypothetical protein